MASSSSMTNTTARCSVMRYSLLDEPAGCDQSMVLPDSYLSIENEIRTALDQWLRCRCVSSAFPIGNVFHQNFTSQRRTGWYEVRRCEIVNPASAPVWQASGP